ncbi:MAG TPA: hypothetical protein VN922_23315, partial [Bacteroidia bacterium]|nr:hypothetical protein [Bacteroidia bacterium]
MNYNQHTHKFFIVVSIALVIAIAVPTNAVLADTSSPPYLNIKTAVVNGAVNGAALQAVLYTGGHIPKDGSGGAFG